MTQTSDGFEIQDSGSREVLPSTVTVTFPTEWHMIDDVLQIQCRQVSEDSYELQSHNQIMTLNAEGFDLFRDDTLAGQVIFSDWCERSNVAPTFLGTNDES